MSEKELVNTLPHFKGSLSQVFQNNEMLVPYGAFKEFTHICDTYDVKYKLHHMENYAAYIVKLQHERK